VKPTLWRLAQRCGVVRAWRQTHRHSIAILAAHGVMDDGDEAAWRPLWARTHVEQLERVLRLLMPHYEFVPLSEAVQMLRGEVEPRRHCMALTFDDGYRNNLTHALPILERLGIPAAFFVCPGMIGTRRAYWIDRLDYAIQHLPAMERIVPLRSGGIALRLDDRDKLAAAYRRLRIALKSTYTDDFDEQVGRLASDLEREAGTALTDINDDDPWSSLMSWDQVREAARRGVEIGSHTVDHVRLNFVDAGRAWNQLVGSRESIEAQGIDCRCLAYPYGDYTADVASLAERAGYRAAVTSVPGLNRPGDGVFMLQRVNFPSSPVPDRILGEASGFQDAMAQLLSRKTSPTKRP
jgi:peptidoglycan/xylan/chitin deacetylase (PgdA/CDA1 family)